MIDPDLLDAWAAMFESIAFEMRSVADHARIASRPAVVPKATYGSHPTTPAQQLPPPIQASKPLDEPATTTSSVKYPHGQNMDAVRKTARFDIERGYEVWIEVEPGKWEQFFGTSQR